MASSDEEGAFESADEGETEPTLEVASKVMEGDKNTEKDNEHTVKDGKDDKQQMVEAKTSEGLQSKQKDENTERKEKQNVSDSSNKNVSSVETDRQEQSSDEKKESTEKVNEDSKIESALEEPTANVIPGEQRVLPEKSEQEQKIENALDRLADDKAEQQESSASSWGGWGSSWGSSWISSATASVSSMTQTVGEGLTSVIEGVETSLGVPKPEDLLEETGEEVKQSEDEESKQTKETEEVGASGDSGSGDSFFASFGAFTSAVEKTVSGGLDALEKIGKKTMDVLQEGDPGFRKKRTYFKEVTYGNKPNLSQILREAKEDAARAEKEYAEEEELKKAHFGLLFDDFQGLSHLEALEMLANQSENKVQAVLGSLSGDDFETLKTELIEIKDAFHIDDIDDNQEPLSDEDFVHAITEHLFSLSIAATPDKLKKTQTKAQEWLIQCRKEQEEKEKKDPKDIHMIAIQTLAELTAKSIEQFHKASELMLLPQNKDKEKRPIERATSLSKLTTALCCEVSVLSTQFCECLNTAAESCENPSSVNPLITNVYLEASNSASYIQDAFQLVLPVLQLVAIETANTKDQS
ncbi:protein FAM114A2-like [Glandiceps talaboti]